MELCGLVEVHILMTHIEGVREQTPEEGTGVRKDEVTEE
jgi:hypothetical protein